MIEDIYIDEAGNTGQDLLNSDQGAFVLASNNYSIDQQNVLAGIFSSNNELHFAALKGSQKGRDAIIQFINHPLICEEHIQCISAHKEFVAHTHIVDRLIEPVLYDRGYDIYRQGENIWMSNYIYYAGKSNTWQKDLLEKLLTEFMLMARSKTNESIVSFYKTASNLYNVVPARDRYLVTLILDSRELIVDILQHIDKFSLDVTLSSFYVICDRWHKKTFKRLRIFQDDSKQIAHFREHIDFTINMQIEKQQVGFDGREMTYPTQINELKMVSSKEMLGVQLSDLIASSIAFMYNNKNTKHSSFVEQIQNSRLLDLSNYFAIWPTTAEKLAEMKFTGTGENPLDFLAGKYLKKK